MSRLHCSRRQGELWRGLLLSLLVIGLLACDSKSKDDSKTKSGQAEEQSVQGNKEAGDSNSVRHELKVRWIDINASYVITINGFPALQEYVQARSVDNEFDVQLNTGLVGEGNKVGIRLEPLLTRSGQGLSIGTIELEAQVLGPGRRPIVGAKITEAHVDSVYEAWSDRARMKWKEYRTTVDQGSLDSIRAWAERNPLTVSTTFDNEAGPDFSRIFEEAPRLEDISATRKRLKDYAIHLRDLLQAGDAEAIYQEIQPSISEEIGWYKVTRSGRRDSALTQIRREWATDFQTDFSRSEVGLRRWSSGRVWELFVNRPEEGERPLFWEGPSASYLKVYVAKIGGELRIVRLGV